VLFLALREEDLRRRLLALAAEDRLEDRRLEDRLRLRTGIVSCVSLFPSEQCPTKKNFVWLGVSVVASMANGSSPYQGCGFDATGSYNCCQFGPPGGGSLALHDAFGRMIYGPIMDAHDNVVYPVPSGQVGGSPAPYIHPGTTTKYMDSGAGQQAIVEQGSR
jgi:hypothetical protein